MKLTIQLLSDHGTRHRHYGRLLSFVLTLLLLLSAQNHADEELEEPAVHFHSFTRFTDPFSTYGVSSAGTYIKLGNSIFFLEGLYGSDVTSALKQGLWGGVLPGIIWGLRPWAAYGLQQLNYDHDYYQALSWYVLTALGAAPYLKAQFDNLAHIFKGSTLYSAQTLLIEGLYNYKLVKSWHDNTPPPSLISYYAIQGSATMAGLIGKEVTRLAMGQPSKQTVTLTGDPSRYFFVKVQPGQYKTKNYIIEIQRIRLNKTPIPNPDTPLGRLALAMDELNIDSLHALPRFSPTGNRLNLSFAKKTTEAHPFSERANSDLQLQLDLEYENPHPWIESFLIEGNELYPGEIPAGSYFSIFQSQILNHISDALICSHSPEECLSGDISLKNMNYQTVYSPSSESQLQPISLWVSRTSEGGKATASLGEGVTLISPTHGARAYSKTITVFSQHQHHPTVAQYWLPAWAGQIAISEANSATRRIGMRLTTMALDHITDRMQFAQETHISQETHASQETKPMGEPRHDEKPEQPQFYQKTDKDICSICLYGETEDNPDTQNTFYNCGVGGGCGGLIHKHCWNDLFGDYAYAHCPSCRGKTSRWQIKAGPGQKR